MTSFAIVRTEFFTELTTDTLTIGEGIYGEVIGQNLDVTGNGTVTGNLSVGGDASIGGTGVGSVTAGSYIFPINTTTISAGHGAGNISANESGTTFIMSGLDTSLPPDVTLPSATINDLQYTFIAADASGGITNQRQNIATSGGEDITIMTYQGNGPQNSTGTGSISFGGRRPTTPADYLIIESTGTEWIGRGSAFVLGSINAI